MDDNSDGCLIPSAIEEQVIERTTKLEASSPRTVLPLTSSTGKRRRSEDVDSSGSELDEVDGTSNDCKEETEEEEEVIPAWMRYLPKTNFVPSSSSITTKDIYNEANTRGSILSIRPSSNRFGPTSLTAKSEKRPRIPLNDSSHTSTTSILPSSQQRIQDTLKRSNVSEAAMLFSLSSGLGASK